MEDPTEKRSNDLLYFSGFGMVDPRGPSPEVLHTGYLTLKCPKVNGSEG